MDKAAGDRVAGIILAAGRSRRLGRPKQLLPFGETTLLEAVVERVRGAALDPLVVVLGPGLTELAERIQAQGVRAVLTPPEAPACSLSIRTGLAGLGVNVSAVMLLLGDQPGVGPAQITAVLEGWRAGPTPAVIGSYQGRPGHPFLLAGPALAQLPLLDGEKGVWRLLEAHPEWVTEVPLHMDLPLDVDRWDDYLALLDQFGLPRPAAEEGETPVPQRS